VRANEHGVPAGSVMDIMNLVSWEGGRRKD
jgi:hypothetical protein